MTFHRRQFLRLAGAAVALPAVSRGASAQAYPSRPVRVVIAMKQAQLFSISTGDGAP